MKDKNQLNDSTIFLLFFTSLFFDGFQALIGWIPYIGNVVAGLIGFFAFMTFWLWLHMKGIKMMTPKRFGALGLGGVIEMIPFVNILPAWTMVIAYIIGTTKIKEIVGENSIISKGVSMVNYK
jgi:hypothetical protein